MCGLPFQLPASSSSGAGSLSSWHGQARPGPFLTSALHPDGSQPQTQDGQTRGLSPISQKPLASLGEESEAQRKGGHSQQGLSWGWRSRAEVCPGKASSLRCVGVVGQETASSPCSRGEGGLPSGNPVSTPGQTSPNGGPGAVLQPRVIFCHLLLPPPSTLLNRGQGTARTQTGSEREETATPAK